MRLLLVLAALIVAVALVTPLRAQSTDQASGQISSPSDLDDLPRLPLVIADFDGVPWGTDEAQIRETYGTPSVEYEESGNKLLGFTDDDRTLGLIISPSDGLVGGAESRFTSERDEAESFVHEFKSWFDDGNAGFEWAAGTTTLPVSLIVARGESAVDEEGTIVSVLLGEHDEKIEVSLWVQTRSLSLSIMESPFGGETRREVEPRQTESFAWGSTEADIILRYGEPDLRQDQTLLYLDQDQLGVTGTLVRFEIGRQAGLQAVSYAVSSTSAERARAVAEQFTSALSEDYKGVVLKRCDSACMANGDDTPVVPGTIWYTIGQDSQGQRISIVVHDQTVDPDFPQFMTYAGVFSPVFVNQ